MIARYARAGRHATAPSDEAGYHRAMPDETAAATSLPMLRGERIWLRASTKADFVEDVDAVSDAETGHFLGLKGPIGPEGAEQFAQQVLSQQGQSTWSFTICLLQDNRRIGNCTLRNLGMVAISIGKGAMAKVLGPDIDVLLVQISGLEKE